MCDLHFEFEDLTKTAVTIMDMGVASNRQEEAVAFCWILQNKKTTRLINCLICRKPRGDRPGYDSDQGRKLLFPYPTNTLCGRGLLRLLTCKTDLNVTYSLFHANLLFPAVKTRQESTPITDILYFSSKVKMEGPK